MTETEIFLWGCVYCGGVYMTERRDTPPECPTCKPFKITTGVRRIGVDVSTGRWFRDDP